MMEYLSRLVLRRSRAVLVVALLLSLAGGAASATLFDKLTAGGLTNKGSESGRATRILEENDQGQPNLTLLVSAGPGGVDAPAAAREGARLTQRLAAEEHVVNVVSYWTAGRPPQLRSEKGDKALVGATIRGDETAVNKLLDDLAPRYEGERAGLEVRVGGYAMFQKETTEISQEDGTKGETIAFPLTLVVLVLVFGSVVAACLPLAVALVSMLLGLGVLWVMAGVTELSVFVVSVVTLLGLGLAIDYSLLIVNRYREEQRNGAAPEQAVRTTLQTAGRTVLFSAVTIALVLAGLLFFPLEAVRSLGVGGMVTALLSAAGALTVLPALLLTLGPRVEKGRVFGRRRDGRAGQSLENGFWHRLATFVMRRPVPVATAVIAFLLLLGTPFLGVRLGMPDERSMPQSSQARQVASVIRADFDSAEQNAAQVVVPGVDKGDGDLPGYAAALSELPGVARVDGPTGSYVEGARAVGATAAHQRFGLGDGSYLSVVPASGDPEAAQRLVHDVRAQEAPFEVLVGGMAADSIDTTETLLDRLPYALGAVMAAMVVLLFLLTGSVTLPLLALLLSGLSLTATFGALVWIFQDGHLVSLLGDVTVTGTIASTIPVMLFALSFGLAMDYQVFMLARIREEYARTGSGTEAVAQGLEKIGRMVTAAAVLISIVFLAFTVSGISYVKAYGIGLPLAVLMDATLIRGALLPALMRLGGRATWWAPEPLRRLHGRFGLRESHEPPPGPAAPDAAPYAGVR
ncbi:MMPL family transporter [Streptomyces roseolilacinus]|uniref:Membrane protein n=1 Tax=Streptomyces roseolilacinus TaxID=66904 RepID=A0A918ELG2_9ACTN|nr:MMPL family transporter [Streptomyces roseolilacinus]GGQ13990.1 membrane protein [Streptomyces roseolilacinus]